MRKPILALLSMAAMATACSDRQDLPAKRSGELATKAEYSILQGVEVRDRDRLHAGVPLIRKHVLDTDYNAIGLPLKGSDRGYVWVIANSDSLPAIKTLPEDAPFTVTQDQVADVAKQVSLSNEVRGYLNAHSVK